MAVDRTGSYAIALLAGAALTAVSGLLMVWALRSAPAMRRRIDLELGETG